MQQSQLMAQEAAAIPRKASTKTKGAQEEATTSEISPPTPSSDEMDAFMRKLGTSLEQVKAATELDWRRTVNVDKAWTRWRRDCCASARVGRSAQFASAKVSLLPLSGRSRSRIHLYCQYPLTCVFNSCLQFGWQRCRSRGRKAPCRRPQEQFNIVGAEVRCRTAFPTVSTP